MSSPASGIAVIEWIQMRNLTLNSDTHFRYRSPSHIKCSRAK